MAHMKRDAKCNLYVYKPEFEAFSPGNPYVFCAGTSLAHASDRDYAVMHGMVTALASRGTPKEHARYKLEAGGTVFYTASDDDAALFVELMDDINAHSLAAHNLPEGSNVVLFSRYRR